MNSLTQEINKRPTIIWLALGYLFVSVGTTLLVLERNLDYFLRSDGPSVVGLLTNLGVCILAIVTFVAILKRASIGRSLSIITFAILGLFSIYGAVVLLSMNSSKYGLIPVTVIASKLGFAMLFVGYFAFSLTAKTYFLNADSSPESMYDYESP